MAELLTPSSAPRHGRHARVMEEVTEPVIAPLADAAASDSCPVVSLRNINKSYGEGDLAVPILHDINLQVEQGEYLAIMGPSGSGKSTLMNIVGCLDEATSGSYLLNGTDVTQLDDEGLSRLRNRTIGFVFQNFNLLPRETAQENVALPMLYGGVPRAERADRAREALEHVGLGDRVDFFPTQLSGGQKQRVAIARALATKPKYLLCDEATSALDPTTTRAILELLREINESLGVTIIVITHEMKVIDQICDRVAVIDHSRIAEEGKVSEVFTNPRSQIARDLIIPRERTVLETEGGKRLRLTFDGETTAGPHIAEMILACQAPVSILQASTKELDGVIYGYTIIELPKDEHQAEKILLWLQNSGIRWKEVE
ncbi:MAG: ATP-binding cassette domain-containing protein [Oscillospiraceae bacterium]|nr:ATP-binding cassette domain-containing protein [Oscillospiraceae bacterium]